MTKRYNDFNIANQLMELVLSDGYPSLRRISHEYPHKDIYQEGDNLIFELALAGFSKDDITVSVEREVLTITGEVKKDDKDKDFYFCGISKRPFKISFNLPKFYDDPNEVSMKDGVLRIVFPPTEEHRKKVIEIA